MNEPMVVDRAAEWRRLKALVLATVSSLITRRVYNLGLDEFIAWYTLDFRSSQRFSANGNCRISAVSHFWALPKWRRATEFDTIRHFFVVWLRFFTAPSAGRPALTARLDVACRVAR